MSISVKKPYIYDVNTTNISFLQTSADLGKLGIKNNMFFLKLYDTSLIGVDVYAPYLTEKQMVSIINECIRNPWYYLREVCRIEDSGGAGIPYQLNRANLAVSWCFINHIDCYLTISRQIGKTQSILAVMCWAFLFGTSSSHFLFFNKSQEDSNANLERLKEQRALLPKFLQFKVSDIGLIDEDTGRKLKDIDNVKTLFNAGNKNKITTKPSAGTKDAAEKLGRTLTPLFIVI